MTLWTHNPSQSGLERRFWGAKNPSPPSSAFAGIRQVSVDGSFSRKANQKSARLERFDRPNPQAPSGRWYTGKHADRDNGERNNQRDGRPV